MLERINHIAHGYVLIPVVSALDKIDAFSLLLDKKSKPISVSTLCQQLNMHTGYCRIALRMLSTLSWLKVTPHTDKITLHPSIKDYRKIANKAQWPALYQMPLAQALLTPQYLHCLKTHIEWLMTQKDHCDQLLFELLNGPLATTVLMRLYPCAKSANTCDLTVLNQFNPPVASLLMDYFRALGWVDKDQLNDTGQFIFSHALNLGVTASYRPMLSNLDSLLLGDTSAVFEQKKGHESHIDRTLNAHASGYQHKKYFTQLSAIVKTHFQNLTLEKQPKYIIDTGCGNGALLKQIYTTICQETERGKHLSAYPLTLIGVDLNPASRRVAKKNLSTLPHLLIAGDILRTPKRS